MLLVQQSRATLKHKKFVGLALLASEVSLPYQEFTFTVVDLGSRVMEIIRRQTRTIMNIIYAKSWVLLFHSVHTVKYTVITDRYTHVDTLRR